MPRPIAIIAGEASIQYLHSFLTDHLRFAPASPRLAESVPIEKENECASHFLNAFR